MKSSDEIETTENKVVKKVVAYTVLVALVFISAMMVVFQVFEYRHDYRELSSYMRERDDLNAEWGRFVLLSNKPLVQQHRLVRVL